MFVIQWKYSGGVVYLVKRMGEDTFWDAGLRHAEKFAGLHDVTATLETIAPEFPSAKVVPYEPTHSVITAQSPHSDGDIHCLMYFVGQNTDAECIWSHDMRQAYRFGSEAVLSEMYSDIKRIYPTAEILRD